jgi:beta-galactosidase
VLLLLLVPAGALGSCAIGSLPGAQATLKPTLELRQADGGTVAFQSGQPVPDFGLQPRPRIDLAGAWRFQPAPRLDDTLTFGDRAQTQRRLTAEAGDRLRTSYDDSGWRTLSVPGTFDPPPDGHLTGAWYRRQFPVPTGWLDHSSLKFASADYVADVWLNGKYLGYHEGGSTPFALDAGSALERGAINTLLVRVARPELGTRLDVVPWGLTDWWDYGGITGEVWLEGEPGVTVVRADVVPHLDGADIQAVVQNRGSKVDGAKLELEVLPAAVTQANLLTPDARSLIAAGQPALLSWTLDLGTLDSNVVRRVNAPFLARQPDLWSPILPALYVVHVSVTSGTQVNDDLFNSFGLRQVQVDPNAPRLLLNGAPVAFHGVALHDERVDPAAADRPAGGPATDALDYLNQLEVQAGEVNADLVRADHTPPNPLLLMLADRLGFAVWEEIPLYHFTPQTFQVAMQRGIPQQMLAEMALRDFDHPSVLFHGFANESQGNAERVSALATLRDLDRRLDGTRLTGQAAYGYDPGDTSSGPLDVAGVTFYYGVFYGGPLGGPAIRTALDRLHATYPKKPIMILEFGRWADSPAEEAAQKQVFDVTYGQLAPLMDAQSGGYVGGAVWWSLNDYWTERPGIVIEHFGLYRPDGTPRPAQFAVAAAYATTAGPAGPATRRGVVSGGVAVPLGAPSRRAGLGGLLVYGLAFPTVLMIVLVVVLANPRLSRHTGGSRPRPG